MRRLLIATAAAAGLVVSTHSAAQEQPMMQDLGSGVYHFFEGWYSSLVVVTDEGVLIADPAWAARAQTLSEHLAEITDQKVTKIVLSHEHYDHVGGTEVFPDAEIICHESCQQFFALDEHNIAPKKVDVTFGDKHTIDMGGKIVELHHLGPGDGVATTVIHLPDAQVVATTDLYGPQSLTPGKWLDDKNFLGNRKILNELKGWKPSARDQRALAKYRSDRPGGERAVHERSVWTRCGPPSRRPSRKRVWAAASLSWRRFPRR